MAVSLPGIGQWYFDRDEREVFEVVALDEARGTVEVQFLDGAIGEFDLETWRQLALIPAAPPEDSDIAYELSQEDRWHEGHALTPDPWNNPITTIEPELFPGFDDY